MKPVGLFPFPIVSPCFRLSAVILALIVVVLASAPARADNLDVALLKNAPEVIRYLRDHHCRNVGILKFRAHKAGHPVSFNVGTINDNIVERLENALIAANPSSAPVGIIHDANHVAVAQKLSRYDNPVGQRALFEQKYPLAWGNAQVSPDLLLTGVVSVRADLKSVTVLIEAFGPSSSKQDKVVAFRVDTDRSLLADLNESFQVKSRQLRGKKRFIELDEDAVADAAEDNAKPKDQDQTSSGTTTTGTTTTVDSQAKSGADDLLHYEIRYDGQPQQITSDPNNPGELQVAEPRENQKVSFYLKSQATERIGLVLMVNGKSTLYEEEGDPNRLKAWVLEPGQVYGIEGFQIDSNTRKPFRVLSDAESAAVTYGPNTGLIQFHIFRSGGASGTKNIAGGDNGTKDDPSSQAMNISLRGLKHSALVRTGKTRSLAELKRTVKEHAQAGPRKRGLVDGADAVTGAIRHDEVQNPVLVQSIVVRYYKPKGS